jgi:hypothetical protein
MPAGEGGHFHRETLSRSSPTLCEPNGECVVATAELGAELRKQNAIDQEHGAVGYLYVGQNGFHLTVDGDSFATN